MKIVLILVVLFALPVMPAFGDGLIRVHSLEEGLALLDERIDRLNVNLEEMAKRQTEIESQHASLRIWIIRRRQ